MENPSEKICVLITVIVYCLQWPVDQGFGGGVGGVGSIRITAFFFFLEME